MEVEAKLIKRGKLEKTISKLNHKNFYKAKEMLQEFLDNTNWIVNIIRRVAQYHIFNFKLLGDLASSIPNIEFGYRDFDYYLYQRGYFQDVSDADVEPIKSKLKPLEEYENPIKQDTLEFFIYVDDLHKYLVFVTENDIDIKNSYIFSINGMVDISASDFIFYCASMNIIKYLIFNGFEIKSEELRYSIESNSEELVQFLNDKGYSFKYMEEIAITCHHNKIAKWIIDEYPYNTSASYCVLYDNTEILLYILENYGDDLDYLDTQDVTAIDYAVMDNDLLTTKFLLLIGADPDVEGYGDMKAIDFAKTEEMKQLLSEDTEVCEELMKKYNKNSFQF